MSPQEKSICNAIYQMIVFNHYNLSLVTVEQEMFSFIQ